MYLKSILTLVLALSVPCIAQEIVVQRADRGVTNIIFTGSQDNSAWLLLYTGGLNGQLFNALVALTQRGDLVPMGIRLRQLQPSSPEYARFVNESGFSQNSQWGFAVPEGNNRYRILLQGTEIEMPTAEDIHSAIENAGIKSPIKVLTDFLKTHPDHLDVRIALLNALRPLAEERTRDILKLDIKSNYQQTQEERMRADISNKYIVDIDVLGDQKLDSEQDEMIWGQYAKELQVLFKNSDWRLVSLPRTQYQIPIDACSPLMVEIYRQNIPKVEAYLEEYPSNDSVWRMYGYMTSMVKQYPNRALLDRIAPFPDMRWPAPEVLDLLLTEDRVKGNWNAIAETMVGYWSSLRNEIFGWFFAPQIANMFLDNIWSTNLELILESTIKANRIEDAETIIADVARVPRFKDIQRRAAELANKLGRPEIQTKWLNMSINEKEKTDIEDIYQKLGRFPLSPKLVIINGSESDNKNVDALLKQSRIIDWRVIRSDLGKELTAFLQDYERWPEDGIKWALFFNDDMLSFGQGFPIEEILVRELESSRAQIPAYTLRRFISNNPTQFEAKESLLRELKRIAEAKTWEKLGVKAGNDLSLELSNEDDHTIWSNYATLYSQLLPYFLENGRPFLSWVGGAFDSKYFIHSKTMKNLARSFLSQIEVALRRQPTDKFLWNAWIALDDLNDRQNLIELLDSLEFSPLANTLAKFPPDIATLRERYKERSNWRGIIDLQERLWEARQDGLEQYTENSLGSLWHQSILLWLEAYLRLDKTREANELIQFWSQYPFWGRIKQSAVDLAKKCEKETLAERWDKL
ncbi:MAG: hypothetical protein FWG02_05890 [Holophagaceae bacterium]|nr:hypothetical protein [Holophagaceae bacterium]